MVMYNVQSDSLEEEWCYSGQCHTTHVKGFGAQTLQRVQHLYDSSKKKIQHRILIIGMYHDGRESQ